MRAAAGEVLGAAGRVTTAAGGALGGLASLPAAVLRRAEPSPLHAELGEQRRLAVARTRLADYRTVRDALGGSVNDVVLAAVAGALRGWLLARAEPLRPASTVRALVPMAGADGIRPLLVDLPVGEPDPALRLAQLQFTMAGHKAAERAVSADRIAGLSGFAPPTLHALSARAAGGLARRLFHLVVTNVPGPQVPLYAAGARLAEIFPILPLAPGQAVTIALTSYDGGVFYGVNGDREAMRDVGVFARSIEESLAELVSASSSAAAATGPNLPHLPRKGRP
jgi:WS/DGAT/MGAT family acyltransferase